MADVGGTLRAAGREAALAWSAVVAEPGRFIRYGGVPLLAAIGIQLWLAVTDPLPAEAQAEGGEALMQAWVLEHGWLLIAWMAFSVWASVRLMVQTTRWAMAGEEGASLLAPAFGLKELRYFGWSLVVGLATLPPLIVMGILIAILTDLAGGEGAGAVIMAVIGTLLGYAGITYVMARLLPGLVPVAFGRPGALGESWRGSAPAGLFGAALVYAVLAPVLLLSLALGGGGFFTVMQTILTLLGYIAYAALAVAIVRFWYRAGEPGK